MTTTEVERSSERRRQLGWTDSPRSVVLVFTALFVGAEAIGAFVSIPAQAALEASFAFVAINVALFGWRTKRTAGLVMAALFTGRLTVLTIPVTHVAVSTRIGIAAIIGIAIAYIATRVLLIDVVAGRSEEGYQLRKPIVSRSFTAAITVLSGFPIGWLAYRATMPDRFVVQHLLGGHVVPWLVAICAIALGALSEELLYRRLVAAMVQHTGQSQTPYVSAVLYGSIFLGTHNLAMITSMTGAGAIFAWSCERTGSTKPVVAAHFIASLLVLIVLPAPAFH